MPASPQRVPKPRDPGKPNPALKKAVDSGLVAVPRGPFGIFGETVMSVKEYQRRAQRRQPAKRGGKKATQKRWILWPLIYVDARPKKASTSAKKKRWIIPGILYW